MSSAELNCASCSPPTSVGEMTKRTLGPFRDPCFSVARRKRKTARRRYFDNKYRIWRKSRGGFQDVGGPLVRGLVSCCVKCETGGGSST